MLVDSRFMSGLQAIAERLRADTDSDRTTIRVECVPLSLGLESVAVESLGEEVNSIKSLVTQDIRNGAAPRWLAAHKRTFVMDDCLNPWDPDCAPEDYVIDTYGVRAEMVSPVFLKTRLSAILSVHYTRGLRHWTEPEIARVEAAGKEVEALLYDRVGDRDGPLASCLGHPARK